MLGTLRSLRFRAESGNSRESFVRAKGLFRQRRNHGARTLLPHRQICVQSSEVERVACRGSESRHTWLAETLARRRALRGGKYEAVRSGRSVTPRACCLYTATIAASGAGTQPMTPVAYAGGSPNNTTSAFDGTYAGVSTQDISKGNTLDIAGGNAPIVCQDYGVPPPVTIHNGLAQFQLLNYAFQGYVTPQGHLKMSAGYGQTIDGQIDNQGVYAAQGVGACAYHATWRRSG